MLGIIVISLLVIAFVMFFVCLHIDVRREVKLYPRVEMVICDKHGMIQVGKETINMEGIETLEGKPFQMCIYCYYSASLAIDKQLKEVETKKL